VHYELRAFDLFGIRVEVLPDLDADGVADLAFGTFSLESDSGEHGTQRLQRLTAIPALACGTTSVSAEDYSGAWFDAEHPGEGRIVQSTVDGRYPVLWFTYAGDGAQQWLTALAPREGARLVASTLVRPVGGRFGAYFDPSEVSRPAWGTLAIEFASCNAGA